MTNELFNNNNIKNITDIGFCNIIANNRTINNRTINSDSIINKFSITSTKNTNSNKNSENANDININIYRYKFTDEFTKYRYVEVPCEIQSVSYLYEVRSQSLFQLGINTPNLSVNLGVTNQPYLSSYVTTIGELGLYKTVLDNMSDMLNQMNKYTLKHHFNQLNHRLHILTNVKHDVVIEAYANIPRENLFKDDLFYKYCVGYAKIMLGNMVGRYDWTLPGSVKINSADLVSQGQAEVKEVEDEVKGQSNSSFFFMVKR
jgi:hypothetical protein